MRSPALTRHIAALPAGAWHTARLDRDGTYRRPKVVDEQTSTLSAYPGTVRQLIVAGLGQETPAVIITNDRAARAKALIERYARRMNIEQSLAHGEDDVEVDVERHRPGEGVEVEGADGFAGAVCAALRRRLTGYHHATPDTLQRGFLSTGGVILNHDDTITVRLNRRTYSPVLRRADIPDVAVPWWGGRRLHFQYH